MRIRIINFLFLLSFLPVFVMGQQVKPFQRINFHGQGIHAVEANADLMAVNLDNKIIQVYALKNDAFILLNTFNIKGMTNEYGTMQFIDSLLFVSVDGFKICMINLQTNTISKTNTYDEERYIKSSYGPSFSNEYWTIKEGKKNELLIYKNGSPKTTRNE